MREHVFRLKKGQDLKVEIEKYVQEHQIKAGVIVSSIGYLSDAILQNLYQKKELIRLRRCKLDILSLTGNLSIHGNHTLLTLIDDKMQIYEGQMQEGCIVNSTAEIVILELESYTFFRELDIETGHKELEAVKH